MSRPTQILETPRLILRPWRADDEMPFIALNADPQVMEFFPSVLTPTETRETIQRMVKHFDDYGYGLYSMEAKSDGDFLGICGVFHPSHVAPYTPCYEIGWRLKQSAWNQGLATEAARRSVQLAFEELKAPEVVAVTAPINVRSRRVMEKLGMTHDPAENFDHPKVPAGHPLVRHVVYRLKPEQFKRS